MDNIKNIGKRGLSLLLVLVMCLSMLNLTVFAEDNTDGPHVHDSDCYAVAEDGTKVLTCTKPGTHSGKHGSDSDWECYRGEQICEDTSAGHKHTADCYEPGECILSTEGHKHTEKCYSAPEEVLICTEEEHTHEEGDCYELVLSCDKEEHEHDSGCYVEREEKTLNCTEGHEHDDGCYKVETVKVKTCEEAEHTHTSGCYTKGMSCEKAEHKHTSKCYALGVPQLICGQDEYEAHSHEDDGCVYEQVLKCEQEETKGHEHSDSCYEWTCEYVGLRITDCTCNDKCSEANENCPVCAKLPELCQASEAEEAPVTAFKAAVSDLTALVDEGLTEENIEDAQAALEAALEAYEELSDEQKAKVETEKQAMDTAQLKVESFSADWTEVNSAEDLKTALTKATEPDADDNIVAVKIKLTGNIETSESLTVSNTSILDLNGQELKASGITVSGNLIIQDNGTAEYPGSGSITASSGKENPGKLGQEAKSASYSNRELTYSVTGSKSDSKGLTQERTTTYTLSNAGAIASAPITVNGSLTLESGCLVGNTNSSAVKVEGGAVTMKGGIIAANTSRNGGGVTVSSGTFTMTDGVISGNQAISYNGGNVQNDNYGGGIFANGGKVVISGGYVTNNRAEGNDSPAWTAGGGGGIALNGGSAKLTVNGGYITGNYAKVCGGGIFVKNGSMDMGGGTIANNYADKREGGGIFMGGYDKGLNTCSGQIDGGFITNNKTNTSEDWGGGGLMIAEGSTMEMTNVLVTANTAQGLGGGVAGCATGDIKILIDDGLGCFNNTANGQNFSGGGSAKHEDHFIISNEYTYKNDAGITFGPYSFADDYHAEDFRDYYCHSSSKVYPDMLGGGYANWTGVVNDPNDGGLTRRTEYITNVIDVQVAPHTANAWVGLTAHPDSTDKAYNKASLYITGNESNTHGGGFMCNGTITLGKHETVTNKFEFSIEGAKTVTNNAKANLTQFQFALLNAEPTYNFATGKLEYSKGVSVNSGKDGKIQFSLGRNDVQLGENTFYVAEVPGTDDDGIAYSSVVYKIVLTVTEDSIASGGGGSTTTTETWKVTNVTVESRDFAVRNSGYVTVENAWTEGKVENINFENSYKPIKVEGQKTWKDSDNKWNSRPEFIEVQLLQNGTVIRTQRVTAANNWKWSFSGLPKYDDKGNAYVYTVKEVPVTGYESTVSGYSITNAYQSSSLSIRKVVTGIESKEVFTFGVKLFKDNVALNGSFEVTGAEGSNKLEVKDGVGTIKVKAGSTATITGLPAGATYTVLEQTPDGYKPTAENYTGTLESDKTVEVKYTNEYSPLTVNPQVTKTITGAVRPGEKTFTFEIAPIAGAPLPKDYRSEVTITSAGRGQFDPITFTQDGTYQYKITEVKGNEPGYTYDTSVWTMTVVVGRDYRGDLKVTTTYAKDGKAATAAAFTNEYKVEPVAFEPKVEKIVRNNSTSDVEFTFNLAVKDNPNNGAVVNTAKATVKGNGTTTFKDGISFTKAGVYTFTIEEEQGSASRYTYDTSKWTLTVTVKDKDGKLVVDEVTYVSSDETQESSAEEATFINTYTPPRNPPKETPKDPPEEPEKPETPPDIDIEEPDVPLTDLPDLPEEPAEPPEIDIPEEDVPLVDVPSTGDNTGLWFTAAMMSACGLAALSFLKKREK